METSLLEENISVWCHTCANHGSANWSGAELEYLCITCGTPFVEMVNQGIDQFTSSNSEESSASFNLPRVENVNVGSASRGMPPGLDHNLIVQQVLEQVLGIGTQIRSSSSQGNTTRFIQRGGSRRPMEVIINRGPSLGGVVVPPRVGPGLANNQAGVFGLLQSIANLRQASAFAENPNALSNAQFEEFLHHLLMNESSHAGAPAASDSEIEALPRLEIKEDTDISSLGDCCISQEPFEIGDFVVSLPCGHNYKNEPITHWLKMHATCPVCRVNIHNNT